MGTSGTVCKPVTADRTEIRLPLDDATVRTRRLDRGYDMRTVEVRAH